MRTAASPASSRGRRGKRPGIEQQQQIDVGRIVEFAAAELAHGNDGETCAARVGHALRDRGPTASSIAASAKSDSNSRDSSSGSSPERSPRATARARPYRCRRKRRSTEIGRLQKARHRPLLPPLAREKFRRFPTARRKASRRKGECSRARCDGILARSCECSVGATHWLHFRSVTRIGRKLPRAFGRLQWR